LSIGLCIYIIFLHFPRAHLQWMFPFKIYKQCNISGNHP
jgi:hypothetical protein